MYAHPGALQRAVVGGGHWESGGYVGNELLNREGTEAGDTRRDVTERLDSAEGKASDRVPPYFVVVQVVVVDIEKKDGKVVTSSRQRSHEPELGSEF